MRARGLVVSDVDSTLITQEVIELVAEYAGVRGQVQEVTERAMRGEIDFTRSLHYRVSMLTGLDAAVLDRVQQSLELTPGAADLVDGAHARGWVIALVSGGFHDVIDPLATQLGVDHVLANRFEIIDGRLSGRVLGPVVDGARKEQTLRELAQRYGIPLSRTIAVGDGANDLPMMKAAGRGIAFCAKPVVAVKAPYRIKEPNLALVLPHLDAIETGDQR
ncbi:phosphoserine phosphatase SerB [Devriesea agamarum]|uniref:phosphoserine phosphatase SerB n=1 Tax=Devriesea agamarum TaxID=472569 RepID=UPI00071E6322|nr:phosphoserine phosphatase SerB [Devriesea agamarum]